MVLFEGYFDESGDLDVEPGIFCVAGYFITSDQARLMATEWERVLKEHNIPYFHMVDCAPTPPSGVFKGKSDEERTEIVKKLIALIKTYTLEGVSILARWDAYKVQEGIPDVYSECASACAHGLRLFLQNIRATGKIAYFFEQGHISSGRAYNYIAEKIKRPEDTLTFASKEEVCLLQAADLFAWQSAKYAKDWFYPKLRDETPKRAPRKDFQSLMEHPHTFYHLDKVADSLGVELWPLSRRSQSSVDLELHTSGPISYLLEENDETPIAPVEKTLGWREGGSRFAYVRFQGVDQKKFALAFDELRLFEAVTKLIEATQIYENSEMVPLFCAGDAAIERIEDVVILRIKLRDAASIAFHLPADVFEKLKKDFGK